MADRQGRLPEMKEFIHEIVFEADTPAGTLRLRRSDTMRTLTP